MQQAQFLAERYTHWQAFNNFNLPSWQQVHPANLLAAAADVSLRAIQLAGVSLLSHVGGVGAAALINAALHRAQAGALHSAHIALQLGQVLPVTCRYGKVRLGR
jgi:hypothetical protein